MTTAATRWADALARWAIPDHILDQAPASPWVHPPAMFRSSQQDPADTPSMLRAGLLLGSGGSVLDVGCGGGRSSLPLGRLMVEVIGVDEQQAMLDQFAAAAEERGIPCRTALGRWPADADATPDADLVVCHHVAYNVAAIGEFVSALDRHARRGVVVELPDRHPQSPLNDLWHQFWNLDRPVEPSADLFVDVVREIGREPLVERWRRPARPAPVDRAALVAFVRQRLCLHPGSDAEIDAALGPDPQLTSDEVVTVSWLRERD